MFKYNSFLLIVFLLFASQITVQAANINPIEGPENLCKLPAPGNFHVTGYSGNSVSLAWNPVAGAIAYSVETFDPGPGGPTPPQPVIVAGTSVTIDGLQSNHTYEFKVSAVCASGLISPNGSLVTATTGIVIDLIASAYDEPRLNQFSYSPIGQYVLPWVVNGFYWFKIGNGSNIDLYQIKMITTESGSNKLEVKPNDSNSLTYPFGNTSSWQAPDVPNVLKVRMFPTSDPIDDTQMGDFVAKKIDNYLIVNWYVHIFQGTFTMYELAPGFSGGGSADSDRSSTSEAPNTLQISPNPFQSNIQITGLNPNVETTLQLFRYDGTLIQSKQSTTVQDYNFQTSDLPAGVYFLRTVSEGIQNTHKLVKIN